VSAARELALVLSLWALVGGCSSPSPPPAAPPDAPPPPAELEPAPAATASSPASTRAPRVRASEFASWVGSYRQKRRVPSGDEYSYSVDLLDYGEVTLAEITVSGWQEGTDVLCNLRALDAHHLELRFDQFAPGSRLRPAFARGDLLLTLVRRASLVELEWAKLEPRGVVPEYVETRAPAPPTGAAVDGAYPSDFLYADGLGQRLDSLLGDHFGRLATAFSIQSPVTRRGSLILMAGSPSRSSDVRAGIAFDQGRNTLHAFLYDPECLEELHVWSERWPLLTPDLQRWAQAKNQKRVPVIRHKPAPAEQLRRGTSGP
jgi:hypothetical protein